MKICYLINKEYYNLTLTSISSIKRFYKSDKKIEFYIFHFGDLTDEKNSDAIFVEIERTSYPFFLHRCFLFDYFKEKIIFIDSDTICQTNIEKLYNIDLDNKVLGAVQHNWLQTHKIAFTTYNPTDELQAHIIKDDYPFFNAGVLLVDCKKWGDQNFTTKILSLFETYKNEKRYCWNDEVALNVVLGRNFTKFLDVKWNYNMHNGEKYSRMYISHNYGQTKNLSRPTVNFNNLS
jgi:lipopolysaccharide biosynthesis glycosyltransferase